MHAYGDSHAISKLRIPRCLQAPNPILRSIIQQYVASTLESDWSGVADIFNRAFLTLRTVELSAPYCFTVPSAMFLTATSMTLQNIILPSVT
jgi:hypothetical protein